jgi:hypothetical protein
MRIALALGGLALVALTGCSSSREATKSEPAKRYTSEELHASFRVPASWDEPKSWNPLRSRPYVARFEAPSDDVAVVLAQAPFTGGECRAAALSALRGASDASLSVEREFKLATPRGELPAGQGGTTAGDRQGRARFFCSGTNAVVLEVSAPKSVFVRHPSELDGILDSLTFDADAGEVAVRAPVEAPPAPSYFIHVVRFRGQTLGRLAEWYTGAYENWPKLARANGEPVPNSLLSVGREIKIPSELMVRDDPPPEPTRRRPPAVRRSLEQREAEAPAESPSEPAPSEKPAPELPPVIGPR